MWLEVGSGAGYQEVRGCVCVFVLSSMSLHVLYSHMFTMYYFCPKNITDGFTEKNTGAGMTNIIII